MTGYFLAAVVYTALLILFCGFGEAADLVSPWFCRIHRVMDPRFCLTDIEQRIACPETCGSQNDTRWRTTTDMLPETTEDDDDDTVLVDILCSDKLETCSNLVKLFHPDESMTFKERALRVCTSKERKIVRGSKRRSVRIGKYMRRNCGLTCNWCLRDVRKNCFTDISPACQGTYLTLCPSPLIKGICQRHCNVCNETMDDDEGLGIASNESYVINGSTSKIQMYETFSKYMSLSCLAFLGLVCIIVVGAYLKRKLIRRVAEKEAYTAQTNLNYSKRTNYLTPVSGTTTYDEILLLPPPPPPDDPSQEDSSAPPLPQKSVPMFRI